MITPREMMGRSLDDKIFAIGSNAGGMLGYGVGKLLGGQTPEEAQNEQMRGMLGGVNMNDPESLFAAAQNIQGINPAAAQALVAQATDLQTKQVAQQKSMMDAQKIQAEMQAKQAETATKEREALREEQYRTELAELPPDATDADVERVARKYGKADELLKIAERRQARADASKEREAKALQDHQNRIEIAQLNNASRADIAAMNRQFQSQLTLMRREDKAAERAAKNSGKTLPVRLQTAEDDDFSAIDTASAIVSDIAPIINNLDTKALNLSKVNQLKMKSKAFFGTKDPEVLQFQELERNLRRFVNESLRLNKGTQTDGDAQRAADEYEAAYSKNSSEGMKAALKELEKINNRQITNRQKQVDRRRKAQGVEAYFEKSDADVMGAADRILQGK
jgi:hypothetical protein